MVIPHYGDPGQTYTLIEQLLAQETETPIEVIVSDDASPEPFCDGEGFRVIRAVENGGFGAAVNRGADLAALPLLLILNSDIRIDSRFVDRLLESANPWLPGALCGVHLSGGPMNSQLPRRFPKNRYYFFEWLGILARWRHTSWWQHLIGISPPSACTASPVDFVIGAAMLVSTSAFREIGGFDERFHMYMEEVDLQHRLRNAGLETIYLPNVTAQHPAFGSSPDSSARTSAVLNARKLYSQKWSGRHGLVLLQLVLTAAESLNMTVDLLRRILGRRVAPLNQSRHRMRLIWAAPIPFGRIVR